MHHYKTVAQILLILSVFNLAFAIPVEREIYNSRRDAVVPVVRRGVETTSEPPSDLDGPPSHSSPPLPDGLPSNGPASSNEIELASPTPGGPATLAGSLPPGGTASSDIVPPSSEVTHWTDSHHFVDQNRAEMERFGKVAKWVLVGGTILTIAGGLLWHNRHSLRRRTIDRDCSTTKGSQHLCPDDLLKDHLED